MVAMVIFVTPLTWYVDKRQQRPQQSKESNRTGATPANSKYEGEVIGKGILFFSTPGSA